MPKRQKREPLGDHEVGYCRPPKASQFKKGEKQNHRRKRAEVHDVGSYVQEELGTLVSSKMKRGGNAECQRPGCSPSKWSTRR